MLIALWAGSFNRMVMVCRGGFGFLALLSPPPPQAPKLKVHFRRLRRVFTPPPPRSKARMPPLSKTWKSPGRNLLWPRRRTPVQRSSSMESGARCRIATPKMHLASYQQFINELTKYLVVELRTAC